MGIVAPRKTSLVNLLNLKEEASFSLAWLYFRPHRHICKRTTVKHHSKDPPTRQTST